MCVCVCVPVCVYVFLWCNKLCELINRHLICRCACFKVSGESIKMLNALICTVIMVLWTEHVSDIGTFWKITYTCRNPKSPFQRIK